MGTDIVAAHSDDNLNDIVKQLNEEHKTNQDKDNVGEKARKESEIGLEECIIDFDIDCPYCNAQNENEKYLYVLTNKEDSDRTEKDELETYTSLKRNKKEGKEEKALVSKKAKRALSPFTERKLSEYETKNIHLLAFIFLEYPTCDNVC
eukprot:TRINITY_DN20757_c0_g1_i1.p1 TRINITY_DN20757_c0_g1~~TRINITY_DN20757_c0_g1_i1.p1  ORF type:complete len:168 (+),score=37.90 TRINITY_DN20757_c0_g1_i1:59-505(+)